MAGYDEAVATAFETDDTPLPPPPPQHDPMFPTDEIPRIRLESALAGESAGAAVLLPRWIIHSRCRSREEFARLHATLLDADGLFVCTRDVQRVGARAAVELFVEDGTRIIAGIAQVTGSAGDDDGPVGQPGMRLSFASLDPDSVALFEALSAGASSRAPTQPSGTYSVSAELASRKERVAQRTVKMFPLSRRPVDAARQQLPLGATVKMSEREVADVLGAGGDVDSWGELLPCRLTIGRSGECEVPASRQENNGVVVEVPASRQEKDETGRSVVVELSALAAAPAPPAPASPPLCADTDDEPLNPPRTPLRALAEFLSRPVPVWALLATGAVFAIVLAAAR